MITDPATPLDQQDERLIHHTGLRGALRDFGQRMRGGEIG